MLSVNNMKVLVIVDIHKAENGLNITKDYINKYNPELLVIAGDITTFGPLSFAEEFLKGLQDIETIALPGNCDPREILSVLDKSHARNLHGKREKINGVTFVGLGGSNDTPFDTPFELSEEEIYQSLDTVMEPGAVLVLHFPVKGYLDEVPGGGNAGSESALKIVKKYNPAVVISGHIHETRGVITDEAGIIYLNPGTLQDGFAALVDISPRRTEGNKKIGKNYDCKIVLLPTNDEV